MHTATLSSKFQICIPKALREELHVKAGQQFILILQGHSLQLVPKRDMKDVKGILVGANPEKTRDREDRT